MFVMKRPFAPLLLLLLLLTACADAPSAVRIDAVVYDGFELANADEAVVLRNGADTAVDVSGWQLTDGDSGTVTLPPQTMIGPQETVWLAKDGFAFSRHFRHVVDFELVDGHTLIAQLDGVWPGLTDAGDELILRDGRGRVVDVLVFKAGDTAQAGWSETAVMPTFVAEEGLFLRRSGTTDTDSAADWVHAAGYEENGRLIGAPRHLGANLEKRP